MKQKGPEKPPVSPTIASTTGVTATSTTGISSPDSNRDFGQNLNLAGRRTGNPQNDWSEELKALILSQAPYDEKYDTNNDGKLNLLDLTGRGNLQNDDSQTNEDWRTELMNLIQAGEYDEAYDVNQDGKVDVLDGVSGSNYIEGTGELWTPTEFEADDDGGRVTEMTGSLDYEKIHPPTPDLSGMDNLDIRNVVSQSSGTNAAIGSLGTYWQETLGADPIQVEGLGGFIDTFGNKFDTDVNSWASDWGGFLGAGDPVWQGGTPGDDDWKKHGGKRAVGPDMEFMTAMETKFKSLETTIGYNSSTDLIGNTFPGYGSEIDDNSLRTRGDKPEIVIGTPNPDTQKLENGELSKSGNPSGAWGDYVRKENQEDETEALDKKDAKNTYNAELKTIRDRKKALGQGAKTGLQDLTSTRSLTGLRQGGRRMGGAGRRGAEGLQAQQRELGGLRESARTVYNKKLERIVLDKKIAIETAANKVRSIVETEFTEMAGDLSIAENTYQSDSLKLEDDRAETMFDIFQAGETADYAAPWPQDPHKEKCYDLNGVEVTC